MKKNFINTLKNVLMLSLLLLVVVGIFAQDKKSHKKENTLHTLETLPKSVTAQDIAYHKESFDEVSFNQFGVAVIVTPKGFYAINKKHQVLYRPFIYDNGPDYVVEGLSRFVENGKMGFVNEKAQKVIPAKFDWVEPFENGKAAFCNGCQWEDDDDEHRMLKKGVGTWGHINKQGKVVK